MPQPAQKIHPFIEHVGIPEITAAAGESRLELEVQPMHLRQGGVMHGGMLATLLDTICGSAAFSAVPPGTELVTIQLNLHYLGTARLGERLVITAQTVHQGRRTLVLQGTIARTDGKILASGSVTLLVLSEGLRTDLP